MREFKTNIEEIKKSLTIFDIIQILKNALGDEQKFYLLNYELKPELKSVGYLGEYYNLNLEYKIENEECVQKMDLFIKTLPYKNEGINDYMKEVGIMRKEAKLYINLLNELQIFSNRTWCAKCYLGRDDLIVLENVKNMGYICTEDSTKFFTRDEMQSVLNSLATMHASSIAYEVNFNVSIGDKFQDLLFETTVLEGNPWYEVGKKTIIELAEKLLKYQNPSLKNFIQNKLSVELSVVFEMVKSSTKYRNVFCHRDLWASNIFFKKSEESVLFVDFQLCRYLPPAIDVLMAIYLGFRPRERTINIQQLCSYYYEKFQEALKLQAIKAVEHISFEQFNASMNDLALFGIFYNCLCATALRLPKNFANNMKVEKPIDLDEFLSVERTKTILKLMEENIGYKEYINECIDDLMEFILLKKKD